MITYQSENGPVEVPAQPKRIVGLTNAPNVVALGGTLVGIDEWTKKNPMCLHANERRHVGFF